MKFQINFGPGQIPGITDKVGLDPSIPTVESGARAQIDGGGVSFSLGQDGTSGKNSIGWETFVLGVQVGGGKANLFSTSVPVDDPTEQSEGAPEHGGGFLEISLLDGHADPAATDPGSGMQDGIGIIEEDFALGTPAREKAYVPASVFAKPPIGPDGNRLKIWKSAGQLSQKRGGFLSGAGLIKREGDGKTDAPALEHPDFVRQSGDEGGMPFRMQNREGMITKSEDSGGRRWVGKFASQNHPLMPEVQAVEEPQGQMTDGCSCRGGSQRLGQIHERRMREISGREIR